MQKYQKYETLLMCLGIISLLCMMESNSVAAAPSMLNSSLAAPDSKNGITYKQMNFANDIEMYTYAATAPCSVAVAMYKSIADSKNSSDSIKVLAYKKLGDYYYANKNYALSMGAYKNASRLSNDPIYKHYWAQTAFVSGDEDVARSLWHTLSLEYGDGIAQRAQYYLGLLCLKQKKYDDAYNYFLKTGTLSPMKDWTIAALAGKLECAKQLGLSEKAALYESQLQPHRNLLLEKDLLIGKTLVASKSDMPAASVEEKDNSNQNDSAAVERNDSIPQLTLQVGAFGTVENAQALQKKLTGIFNNVTVVTVKVDEQVFYRVRIGSFDSREKAEKFGADSLVKSGYSYRIVEK
jgi:tetratricopeptide (TPR) repeat protein